MENSAFGRLIGVLTSPAKTFQAIAQRPAIAVVLLTLIAVSLLATVVITPKVDLGSMVQKSIEQSGREMTPEQMEKITGFYEKFKWPLALGSTLVGQPIFWLFAALIFWVLFKLSGSDLDFKQSLAVTLHAFLPQAVLGLLSIPVALSYHQIGYEVMKSGSFLKSNPAAFMPDGTGPVAMALLGSLDVFVIWTVVLLCIGFRVVAKVKRSTALAVVLGVWAVQILVKVGFAALQGMNGKG